MTLETNKMLGGIGAILLIVGAVSQLSSIVQFFYPSGISAAFGSFGVLALIGLILFVVAMYGLAKDYGTSSIFENVLYGIIASIAAGVVAGMLIGIVILLNFNQIFPTLNSLTSPSLIQSSVLRFIMPILPAIAIAGLFQALFINRAFILLADKSKVPLFRTAGKLMLIGALLTLALSSVAVVIAFVVLLVNVGLLFLIVMLGGILTYVGWLLAAIAFFRISAPLTPVSVPSTAQASPPVSGQVKYCTYCGTENRSDAVYCRHCGKKLATA